MVEQLSDTDVIGELTDGYSCYFSISLFCVLALYTNGNGCTILDSYFSFGSRPT